MVHMSDCRIVKLTANAVLVEYLEEEIWLPLSQVDDPDKLVQGEGGYTISIPEWLAKKNGIEKED